VVGIDLRLDTILRKCGRAHDSVVQQEYETLMGKITHLCRVYKLWLVTFYSRKKTTATRNELCKVLTNM
jgi:hypothetical protein